MELGFPEHTARNIIKQSKAMVNSQTNFHR